MSTVIRNLRDEVVAAASLSTGEKWVKWVAKIDPSQSNTFAFIGEFVESGTVQVRIGTPRLLLVGSKGRRASEYRFVVMEAGGALTPTDIRETDEKRGWALRVRDRVQAILDQQAATRPTLPPAPTPPVVPMATQMASPPSAPDTPSVNDEARQIVVDLYTQNTMDAKTSHQRTAALLRDHMAGRYELELNLLVTALAEGITDTLQIPVNDTPPALVRANLAERLVCRRGIYRELATWVVETWSLALGGTT